VDAEGESRLDVKVHRKVEDGVPLLLVTRVSLEVSGKNREVILGRALPAGFAPLSIDAQLPARLEPDGRLRVQLRPGSFRVEVVSRSLGPVAELALPAEAGGAWAAEEVWALQAAPDVRAVDPEGVPAVDPAQTTLPAEWQALPAFRVRPGESLRLVERRRGDSDPAPDQLSLQRTIWLDFQGSGATVLDRLTGRMTRSARLDADPVLLLGRVSVSGKDQLITSLQAGGAAGIELRTGLLQLAAESRIEGAGGRLPANGWAADLHAVSASLHLPPGWRLLLATGVDDARPTWLARWSLLDLFLVLMVALACGRLFGWGWAAVAFCALGLSLPEGAPRWSWLGPIAAIALVRVLPAGRLRLVFDVARIGLLVLLALFLAPFAAQHLRGGLYPALERSDEGAPFFGGGFARAPSIEAEQAVPDERPEPAQVLPPAPSANQLLAKPAAPKGGADKRQVVQSYSSSAGHRQNLDLTQVDPLAAVQSGPGLPQWSWESVALRWSGPVERGAQLSLWLLPPWANLGLAFLRVALVALLFWRLALVRAPTAVAVAAALAFSLASPAQAGELPSNELLGELREGLTAPPACHPDCASSPRLAVEASGGTLRLRLEIAALAAVSVPLPGNLAHWSPDRVTLDGQPARALRRGGDGSLWVQLGPGPHQLLLEGPLPGRDAVQIALPLRPHRVTAQLAGWTIDGLHDDGSAEENLQLTRAQRQGAREKLEPGQLPPFLQVERTLSLGLTWQVETRVTRRSPEGTAAVVEVPLLPGESVVSAEVRAERGKALVSLGQRTAEVTWRSTLTEAPSLSLEAPRDPAWAEVWWLEVAPVWHVEASGLPAVHREPGAQRLLQFLPWPGERLTLTVTRPPPVPGRTLTVKRTDLTSSPGARTTDVLLAVQLASSRGQPWLLGLPEGAQVQSLKLDGATQPPRVEAGKLSLALAPGQHQISVEWREPRGVALVTRTPRPDLGGPSVNASATLQLGSRWVLFAGGPRLGPAVLFWSFLLVMTLAGVGLSRLRLAPLGPRDWVLLAIGLSQVPIPAAAVVAGWLLALGLRGTRAAGLGARRFDLLQLLLVCWTIAAAAVLFGAIERGLLGDPEMQVDGNSSTASTLRWFSDRADGPLPSGFAVSVPIFVYRLAMLAWALWLASALTRWLPWAWRAFSAGGVWRPWRRPAPTAVVEALPVPPSPPPPEP
jgi:hypothetical protein